jgi:uncharacterized protein
MKYSQFNSIIPFEGKYALFNAFTQRAMFLEDTLKDILNAAKTEGIDGLQEIHPTFYDYLTNQSFIVPSEVNEVDKVKALVKQTDENETSFLLTVNPSMNCNFKCWYCYETHVKDSRLSPVMIDKINRFITNTADKPEMKYFSLSFFGGEPLLYFKKDVTPIIDAFSTTCREKKIDFSVSFTTNGYLVNQEFIDYFTERDLTCSLQITLDGYKEKHDEVRYVNANKGSYEQIIKNIRLLVSNKFFVRLRVNYTEKNLGDAYKIAEEFSDLDKEILKLYMMIDYHRVWQDDKVDDTSTALDQNVEIIRENGINVSTKYAPNAVRDSCYADKRNSAVINYNGDLFKCTARDFTTVKRAGYLSDAGELIWENDYLNTRMSAKFNNKPCLTCRLMPICNGGCSQHAMEHLGGEDYCVYHGDEGEKDKVVKSKIEELLNALKA